MKTLLSRWGVSGFCACAAVGAGCSANGVVPGTRSRVEDDVWRARLAEVEERC